MLKNNSSRYSSVYTVCIHKLLQTKTPMSTQLWILCSKMINMHYVFQVLLVQNAQSLQGVGVHASFLKKYNGTLNCLNVVCAIVRITCLIVYLEQSYGWESESLHLCL